MQNPKQELLFENLPEHKDEVIRFRGLQRPVWTENKARLVAKYLYYFVLITRHGAYIDGFSGPKLENKPETWAAKLVLDSKPQLLRDIFLVEFDQSKLHDLEKLKAENSSVQGRKIQVIHGDFNEKIDTILASGKITEKKATFCLLDQFSTECHWETLVKLASFKKHNKIELFYFLASGWLSRALSGFTQNKAIPGLWWGNDDWTKLQGLRSTDRAQLFRERFKKELGYKYAHPWPIYNKDGDGRRVMFHMIHATDHPEAPKIMWRAYRNAHKPIENEIQHEIPFSEVESIVKAYGNGR